MKKPIIFLMVMLAMFEINAQRVVLNAQQPTDLTFQSGEAYAVINAAFAGTGRNVCEIPDCNHLPEIFEHIRMVYDSILEKHVFEFLICVEPDRDVQPNSSTIPYPACVNRRTDRQRNEIKTDGNSPRHLLGFPGDTVRYNWRFFMPEDFRQPTNAFTHIYQVKPVGGDDSQPIFALTVRTTGIIIRYFNTSLETLETIPFSNFRGRWVEVDHWMVVGVNGESSLVITDVETGNIVREHHSTNILTIRPDNNYIRPKWGIYRSLEHASQLKDERLRFSDFVIEKGHIPPPSDTTSTTQMQNHEAIFKFQISQNTSNRSIVVSGIPARAEHYQIDLLSVNGVVLNSTRKFLQGGIRQDIEICGKTYASGLYLVRITTSTHQETHRIAIP